MSTVLDLVGDLGGVGDGSTSNTAALRHGIRLIAAAGGGELRVDGRFGQRTFLTGPFNLTSNLRLVVAPNTTLLGSTDLVEWPLIAPLASYGQGRDHPGPRRVSLIHGFGLRNVTVTGGGTIDGQGAFWWRLHRASEAGSPGAERFTRGHLVEFVRSQSVELSHLTLRNSPFWTVHPAFCSDVEVHHVAIHNPPDSPQTDGIDPDSSVRT